MAIFNEDAFGAGLTGGFGGVYIRKQNGKMVLCKKPAERKQSKNEKAVKNHSNMKRIMNFSKVVTKDNFFHPLWKAAPIKGISGYHKSNSVNSARKESFNADKLKLLPYAPEISVQTEKASFADRTFFVSLKPLGNDCGMNFQRETFISAGGFVMLSNGTPEQTDDTITIPLKRMTLSANPNDAFDFKLESFVADYDLFEAYTNRTVFVIFSSLNSEEQPVKHSDTFIYRY